MKIISTLALVFFLPRFAAAEDLDLAVVRTFFQPLPAIADSQDNPVTPSKVALGKKLFLDPKLSASGTVSCSSCHDLKSFGVDHQSTSTGIHGKRGNRNAPSCYNAALHLAQFWDGRAKDVEEQAAGPILNPNEMGMSSPDMVVKYLSQSPEYQAQFKDAFPDEKDPVSMTTVGRAIGAFERTLLTPSPFDAFLKGDTSALSAQQKRGLKIFMDTGCAVCHNGVGVGGGMYQFLGVAKPYQTKDLGRFGATKQSYHKYVFKVPSLRNISETAPYFHDGSIVTLPQAIKLMAFHQLGEELSEEQVQDMVSFLKSLTGTHKEML